MLVKKGYHCPLSESLDHASPTWVAQFSPSASPCPGSVECSLSAATGQLDPSVTFLEFLACSTTYRCRSIPRDSWKSSMPPGNVGGLTSQGAHSDLWEMGGSWVDDGPHRPPMHCSEAWSSLPARAERFHRPRRCSCQAAVSIGGLVKQ